MEKAAMAFNPSPLVQRGDEGGFGLGRACCSPRTQGGEFIDKEKY